MRTIYLRDVVYGAMDGAVTTFAIVAGVVGADLPPRAIVVLGLANVVADGFSMAVGNYTGTKSEREETERLRRQAHDRTRSDPAGARRELAEILSRRGLSGRLLEEATEAVAAQRPAHAEFLLVEGMGRPPVATDPVRAGLATFVAFIAAGMVPLVPFLAGYAAAFALSAAATGLAFFTIGALKSHWSTRPWWRSGIETLLVGGAAATLAYAVGSLFDA